jgi:hypothetical protein
MYAVPGQFIEIFPHGSEEFRPGEKNIGYSHFCIEVDDVAKTQEELRGRGSPC